MQDITTEEYWLGFCVYDFAGGDNCWVDWEVASATVGGKERYGSTIDE